MKKYQRNQNYCVSGETFNEIADAVNWTHENQSRLNGPDAFNKSFQNGEIRIKYLESGTLPTFSAVALTGLAITPENNKFIYNTPTLNANKVTSSNEKKPFAICAEPANYGKLTKAVLTGIVPAKVAIKDSTHEYAKPTTGGNGTLESCAIGTARIVWKAGSTGEQWCILQLGGGGVDIYTGPFSVSYNSEENKIEVTAGFLNRNGEWKDVSASSISPENGYICVVTKLNDNGEWSTPEIKITEPSGESYPIGYCKISGESVSISSFHVPVAIFIIAGECDE